MLVIPTYNERENIGELIRRIRAACPDIGIFFVDDNSPDGTADAIAELMASDPGIRLMRRATKAGLGSAYRDAFREVLKDRSTELIITMDADLSHPIEAIASIEHALQSRDLVVGSRYVKGGGSKNWKWFRRVLSRCANFYARLFTGTKISDLTSGMNGYRAEALRKLDFDRMVSDGYAFQIEIKNELVSCGAAFAEVPITFSERREGKSKLSRAVVGEGIAYPLKKFWLRHQKLLFAFLSGLVPLAVYAITAPRTIFTNDNPEFVTVAGTLGVAHPSGYPLFAILSWLFSRLPFGTLPYRVNLFGALCSAAALFLINLILARIFELLGLSRIRSAVLSFLAALGLAFTPMFWYQSIVAKTYTLNLFFVLLAVWLSMRFAETARMRFAYWFALLSGLALTNHAMFLLGLPFLVFLFFKKGTWSVRRIFACFALFAVGLLVYAYVPLRSAMHAGLNWGNVHDLVSFLEFITRAQYRDAVFASDWISKLKYLGDFGLSVWEQFGLLLVLLPLGLLAVLVRSKKWAYALGTVLISNVFGIILLRSSGFSYENSEFYSTYYLPAYAVTCVLIAVGVYTAAKLARRFSYYASAAVLGFVAVSALVLHFPERNFSDFKFIDGFSRATLESLPANATFVVSIDNPAEDTLVSAFMYQRIVNRVRPDVNIVSTPQVFVQNDPRQVSLALALRDHGARNDRLYAYAAETYLKRPIYATFPLASVASFSNGYAFSLGSILPSLPRLTALSQGDEKILSQDIFGQQVLSNYFYLRSSFEFQNGDKTAAENDLIKAIQYDTIPNGPQFQDYVELREADRRAPR